MLCPCYDSLFDVLILTTVGEMDRGARLTGLAVARRYHLPALDVVQQLIRIHYCPTVAPRSRSGNALTAAAFTVPAQCILLFVLFVFGNLIRTATICCHLHTAYPPVPTLAAFKRRHEQPLLGALASALRLRLLPHPRTAASTGAGATGVGAGAMDGGGLGGGGAWGVEADPMLDPRVCGAVVE